jgi:uncharacterized protein YjbI with pentapeptide repeats
MWAVTAHNTLFSAEPNEFTHRRFPFSNTLVLPGLNVYEGLGLDDPKKAKWRDFVFHPRGRDLRGAIFALASLPRVDFSGANLQGARLAGAHLQGASLDSAQLQGASLNWAQLQGANLFGAQLQGASLADAQLQGAWLFGAQLQGAWLARAHLQGASFEDAQLQGVSFQAATLTATDLSRAYLWRSNQAGNPATLSAIRMREDDKTWSPRWRGCLNPQLTRSEFCATARSEDRAWDKKAYEALSTSLQSLPSGRLRAEALKRIKILDCPSLDKTLQSCNPDPAATLPKEAADWKKALMAHVAKVEAYRAALAESLQALFCSGDENEAFVVRTVSKSGQQLQRAGPAASGLIEKLLSKNSNDCPVAASLTDADRATLLRIKQEIPSVTVPGR